MHNDTAAPHLSGAAVYAKTDAGRAEINTRSLGLTPLQRRLLILVDGQRTLAELTLFITGQDVPALMAQIEAAGCVAPVASGAHASASRPAAAPSDGVAAATTDLLQAEHDLFLSRLPPPEQRSAKEVDMAKNYMTNTVNTIYQPYTRLTLLEAIAACRSAQDTRQVYLQWADTLRQSAIGAKRLPEFQTKLAQVL